MVFVDGPDHQLAADPLGGTVSTKATSVEDRDVSEACELVSPKVPATVLNQRIPIEGAWLRDVTAFGADHKRTRRILKKPWNG